MSREPSNLVLLLRWSLDTNYKEFLVLLDILSTCVLMSNDPKYRSLFPSANIEYSLKKKRPDLIILLTANV